MMAGLDNSLPPGLAGFMATRQFNQQNDSANLSNIAGITGILAKLQETQRQNALRDALARQDTSALYRIPGGIELLGKLESLKNAGITGQLNAARLSDIANRRGISDQEQQAKGALANLMTGSGSFGQGTTMERPDAQVFMNDASAIKAMQEAEARGQPFTGNVPNPANVSALALAAGNAIPRGTTAELLKQLGPQQQVPLSESPLAKLQREKSALPPGDPRNAQYDAAIQRQINPTVNNLRIVPDPNDPSKAIFGSPKAGDAAFAPSKAGSLNLMGGRESVFLNRVLTAANQANRDLTNIVALPITASGGWFSGRTQGKGLFEAGKESLTTKMTTQEVQSYNVLATGIQRNLAAIEAAGLAPPGTLMHMMDAVTFKEGDTNFTKIQKLAQTRQIVEAGLETIMANPRVSEEQKKLAEDMINGVRKAVPFTSLDVIKLGSLQETNPGVTMRDIMLINKYAPKK